jgi:hypothetical protein
MEENRESFVFHRDWYEVIKKLPDELALKVFNSILSYAFDGVYNEDNETVDVVMSFIKPHIMRDREKWLLSKEKKNHSKYVKELKDPRWQKLRNEILERDKYTCQICGAKDTMLHVHHKYYKQGLKAWEYSSEALVTVCENCHEEIHKKQSV